MNVYIATKFENQSAFDEASRLLVKSGHKVIHDWTKESIEGKSGHALTHYLQKCAIQDIVAVDNCHAIILIPVAKPMAGAFVELGAALASNLVRRKRIIIVDAFNPEFQKNIFYHLPEIEHAATIAEAVELLVGPDGGYAQALKDVSNQDADANLAKLLFGLKNPHQS